MNLQQVAPASEDGRFDDSPSSRSGALEHDEERRVATCGGVDEVEADRWNVAGLALAALLVVAALASAGRAPEASRRAGDRHGASSRLPRGRSARVATHASRAAGYAAASVGRKQDRGNGQAAS